jgi:hypothetical protein
MSGVNFPVRNMVWFPSFRLIILVAVTLIIETGLLALYCILQNYSSVEICRLSAVVVCANLVTGFIGWIAASWKGWNL